MKAQRGVSWRGGKGEGQGDFSAAFPAQGATYHSGHFPIPQQAVRESSAIFHYHPKYN